MAPYEADAQLAYLQKEGLVDLVITEDSDMLVFGCKRVCVCMCVGGGQGGVGYGREGVCVFSFLYWSRCSSRWMSLAMES